MENINRTAESFTLSSLNFSLTNNFTTEAAKAADCGKYDLIMNALVKFILLGFGTIGNGLSVVVMWSERSKSATAFLLIVLAVVDTLLMYTWTFIVTATGKQCPLV